MNDHSALVAIHAVTVAALLILTLHRNRTRSK